MLAASCGAPGQGRDSSVLIDDDGVVADRSVPPDASMPSDAGARVDAGTRSDAGWTVDAGSTLDAGWTVDAGSTIDAGWTLDARDALDAGAPVDAGLPDAGRSTRNVVVCLTGAFDQSSGSNAGFTQLCDQLGVSVTLVRSCSGATCHSSFATFPATSAGSTVTTATFAALDLNADQRVNANDGATSLTIVGFSWGGVNAGDLAERLSSDARIDHAHLQLRLVILDAYQPLVTGVSPVSNVDEAWSFRHTITPSSDCSRGAPLGPYRGARLRCAAGRACFDHDFSAAPNTVFGWQVGRDIGHCEVPQAAAPFVAQLVSGGIVTALPPSVPVSR